MAPRSPLPIANRQSPIVNWQCTLTLSNRQQVCRVNLRLLRRVVSALLREPRPQGNFDLAIHVVAEAEMTHLNETFLRHEGCTDVITFDHAESAGQVSRLSPPKGESGFAAERRDACPAFLHGEIFVCIDEAISQARRFRATWQSELVRYIVHGVLHLLGYDDADPSSRRKMKAAEDCLVRQLARQFDFRGLGTTA